MISIKRYWEHAEWKPPADLAEALAELQRLLRDEIADRHVPPEMAIPDLNRLREELQSQLECDDLSPAGLIRMANATLEVVARQIGHVVECLQGQRSQMQSMVAMLTETVAGISGQSDASVARLQELERKIEQAYRLDDMQVLRVQLGDCLKAIQQISLAQRTATGATMKRLHDHIAKLQQPTAAPNAERQGPASQDTPVYLAAFKLQRADHILQKFGQGAAEQMLAFISEGLQPLLGSGGRLMRWKGFSFIAFVHSAESMGSVRRRISTVVARISQRYVEVGGRAALLAIGVEWVVLALPQYTSLQAAFLEVDSFLVTGSADGAPDHGAPHRRIFHQSQPEPAGGVQI